ncbi:MAG: hydantoinase/oxoprolinase family protein, partial [Nitratireductor sp.]
ETVAAPHGWSVEQAALAILRIMNNNMVGALRAVLIEQGFDPRQFTLMTFGGAGSLHVCDLMHEANIPLGIVPNHPGQFSAYGFTMADARSDRRRSTLLSSRDFDLARANAVLADLSREVLEDLHKQGHDSGIELRRSMQMRYLGQNYELEVPLTVDRFTAEGMEAIWRDFHDRFEERYRFHLPDEPIEMVDMGCTAIAHMPKPELPRLPVAAGPAEPDATRMVTFEEGCLPTPVFKRHALAAGHGFDGPALVEEDVSVTVVRPGFRLEVDVYGNLVISAGKTANKGA